MAERGWSWLQAAWWLPPAGWVFVVILDILLSHAPNYFLLGVVDEPAHFLTSLIDVLAVAAVLTAIGRPAPSADWALGALLAGNLIDADHVPQVLGYYGFTERTPRPYTHSLTTVVLLLALAALLHARRIGWDATQWLDRIPPDQAHLVLGRWAAVMGGLAVGVAGHLFRDAGTAPVALFWPVSYRSIDYPERYYTLALLLLALIPPAAFALALLRPERARGKQDDDR